MQNNLEEHVKEKVKSLWEAVKIYQLELLKTREILAKNKESVLSLKRENPDLKSEEVHGLISESMLESYTYSLKEQDLFMNYILPLVEYKSISDLFKIELDLDKKEIEYIDNELKNQVISMFVPEKGKMIPKDAATFEKLIEKAVAKFNDKNLIESVYNSPEFKIK